MHDKENDNCVRESCTQYVILRVLHPPWQIYMTSDKTRTIVWKLNSLSIMIALGNPQAQRQFYRDEVRTPPQLKLCLGNEILDMRYYI